MKLDLLVFAAHPDDVELSASGIVLNQVAKGDRVGIVDLTRGELGTRGTVALRQEEATIAAKILGLTIRENLSLRDGFFENDESSILKIIEVIRKYQPKYIIANAPSDRHPDHGRAAELVKRAFFLTGLRKIETKQEPWRPSELFHYIQDEWITPDLVVDISSHWENKKKSILAYSSQFFSNTMSDNEPQTYISSQIFFNNIESRAREMGRLIGVEFGEGLLKTKKVGLTDLNDLT